MNDDQHGRNRPRCPETGKRCYPSKRQVRAAMAKTSNRVKAYFCDACRMWHASDLEKGR